MNPRRILSPMLAATLALTTLTIPAHAQQNPNPSIVSGTFTWGIRKSLVNYVQGFIARGHVTASAGATTSKIGGVQEFSFPIDSANATYQPNGDATLPLKGTVTFQGHKDAKLDRYDLDVTLSDFKLQVKGTNVTVTVDYVTKGDLKALVNGPSGEYGEKTGDDVAFATFTLPAPLVANDAGGYEFLQNDSAVTAQGFEDAFLSDKYAPGTALDAPDLLVRFNEEGKLHREGNKSSVDNENRMKVVLAAFAGVFAVVGAIVAALKTFGSKFGIHLPF